MELQSNFVGSIASNSSSFASGSDWHKLLFKLGLGFVWLRFTIHLGEPGRLPTDEDVPINLILSFAIPLCDT